MRLYEKIVSQEREPDGGSWTESSKSCHVRCCRGFLAVRTETDTLTVYSHTHKYKFSMACTYKDPHKCTCTCTTYMCMCINTMEGLTPLLSVAIIVVPLWINMDEAAPSTAHKGSKNKTFYLTHIREAQYSNINLYVQRRWHRVRWLLVGRFKEKWAILKL